MFVRVYVRVWEGVGVGGVCVGCVCGWCGLMRKGNAEGGEGLMRGREGFYFSGEG